MDFTYISRREVSLLILAKRLVGGSRSSCFIDDAVRVSTVGAKKFGRWLGG
jgi:hypothetical protein